ncbi:MAG: adenylate/guanylate cyclase domain-containing protein [Reyranellaceae bacterium]
MTGSSGKGWLRERIRLQVSISTIFAGLILPALGGVAAFSYQQNVRNLTALSQRFIDRARDDAVQTSRQLLEPVIGTLRMVAAAETATPGFYRSDDSADFLYYALTSAPQVDAVYASFENGFHRVVTRMDADRRRSDPRIPARANWHMSFIDDFTAGADRQRHRTFYETWPRRLGGYSVVAATYDVRTAVPQYRMARQSMGLAVTDPFINPDTGYPVIALGYPIVVDENFTGVASAHITFGDLSAWLGQHAVSAHSHTVIADQNGKLLAHPEPAKVVRTFDGKVQLTDWGEVDDPAIREAVRLHRAGQADRFTFEMGPDATEYVALFSRFPAGPEKSWQVLVVTPTDDFVGDLKRTNRQLAWVILGLVLIESVLIYFMARGVARPIEAVSGAIREIRSLSFGGQVPSGSRIREVAELQQATALLASALRSFSLFAPVGIVRQLIESGRPLAPGMEQRFVTLMFTDVEGFTTIAEQLSPQALSEQTSRYFEIMTAAVAEQGGTIDKFIGDSVMAFWGAPTETEDHVFKACVAALEASRRMRALNDRWEAEGHRRMNVRLGVHCDTVVVGNVGSAERLSYTAMGDGVNLASRIEGLNKQFGTSICISESVHDRLGDRIVARPLGKVAVKGRTSEIRVYELLAIAAPDPKVS